MISKLYHKHTHNYLIFVVVYFLNYYKQTDIRKNRNQEPKLSPAIDSENCDRSFCMYCIL